MQLSVQQIHTAYQAEIRGEAFFRSLAGFTCDQANRRALMLLAELEYQTGERLGEVLHRLGVEAIPDPVQISAGRFRASEWRHLSWHDAVVQLKELAYPYLEVYDRMAQESGPETREALAWLAEHEHALYAFACTALQGQPDEAMDVITSFLARQS